jgi:hypothetical protein
MRVRHLNLPKLREPECLLSSNMQTPTSLNTLNLLDVKGMTASAMLFKLEETFPPTNPTPEDTMEKIMYRSGQRSVVEWVIRYMEEN